MGHAGATGLTLVTSCGGTEYTRGSAMIIGLFAGSVAALVIFVLVLEPFFREIIAAGYLARADGPGPGTEC